MGSKLNGAWRVVTKPAVIPLLIALFIVPLGCAQMDDKTNQTENSFVIHAVSPDGRWATFFEDDGRTG